MVRIELERGTLLAVEVPDGAKCAMVGIIGNTMPFSKNGEPVLIYLPGDGFEPLGLATEITEDQANIVVETVKPHGCKGTYYKEYSNTRPFYSTAIQSMQSLLKANKIYSVNPYYEPEIQYYMSDSAFTMSEYRSDLNKWQEAQQHVKNWFLLFKPKK